MLHHHFRVLTHRFVAGQMKERVLPMVLDQVSRNAPSGAPRVKGLVRLVVFNVLANFKQVELAIGGVVRRWRFETHGNNLSSGYGRKRHFDFS
jgi:hypothetical protein